MREFIVPVLFTSSGFVTVKAESLEDLYEKLGDVRFVDNLPLPTEPEYVEDSYQIDFDGIETYNNQHVVHE